ncbi:response regulator transcription factor [Sporolactobacillus nakayamae]|uniref:DNA-binding response regulator, OmpR family, contains REC and winged-helix (WHTH) domain n=1 Tax=Sporolactobacillus nakayamae TaxID=269670 RepID=A0A1I2SWJ5_9BACL|nr:response regulator transcription factor [Sporolactobacillus nakayamae]SFG57104.1 DNA-binding response regulator, OmpR family, contains REC and winged-helix (wHTH) domain [Sporolactobacillus nakayamae]
MKTITILLVEDEKSVASFVSTELGFENYVVEEAYDGVQALDLFFQDESKWGLVLLDLMLPKLNGLEVCRRIRKKSLVPIIIMTARDYVGDKVAGLDGGADDYITKPFEIEELLARVRVALRRRDSYAAAAARHIYQVGDLYLDIEKRTATRQGKTFDLTQREFNLLSALMKSEGKVMTRDELLSEVWGFDYMGQTNIVDVYVRYLRNKIDKNQRARLIHTIRGVGYALRVDE